MGNKKTKFKLDSDIYQLLFDTSKDPMWLIVDNNFEICNLAAVEVLGYSSKDELTSTHPSQLSPEIQPDGEPSFSKAESMMETALSKGFHQFEWSHRRKNGENFPVEVTLTKVSYQSKDAIYCIWRDITKRKKQEKLLAQSEKIALDANKSKSDFLAAISHDLRTPLNAILGFSEMMKEEFYGPLGSDKYKIYANDISQSGKYLLSLINDILDISKIEAGERKIIKNHINFNDIASDCYDMIKFDAKEKNIKCKLKIDKDLKPVFADQQALMQIMMNLASNAIKFTPEGGTVTMTASSSKNNHIINISDTGIGISSKDLSTIADPFTRAEKDPYKAHEGTGLGLAIVKSLAELHSGSLNIESVVNKGTSVTVTIPSQ